MDTVTQIDRNPIHSPCPDMAGCTNPKPELTRKSLSVVRQLRVKLGLKTTAQRQCEVRQYLSELAQYQSRRDLMAGGVR